MTKIATKTKKPVKKNKKFQTPATPTSKQLTPTEMRIAIAKDVLAQIKLNKLRPTPGYWAHDNRLGCLDEWAYDRVNKDGVGCTINSQDFSKNVKACRVCALGAIFMGVSNLYGIAINFNGSTDDMFEVFDNLAASPLSQYFSKEQLRLMEVSFEGSDGVYGIDDVEKKDRGFALAFHYAFKSPKERLEAMMKNIIANKGIFKPDISLTREMLIKGFEQIGNGHL